MPAGCVYTSLTYNGSNTPANRCSQIFVSQRIEAWWSQLRRRKTHWWIALFKVHMQGAKLTVALAPNATKGRLGATGILENRQRLATTLSYMHVVMTYQPTCECVLAV